jgi:outer membrane lipoprotein carrier protein
MKKSKVLATAAIMSAMIATGASAHRRLDDVQEIVRKTKALYSATNAAELKFVQEGTTGSMSGTLVYAQGNRFRLEFPKQTIVSNGQRTWTYMPDRNQVVVSKASTAKGRLTPNDILTSFPGDYATKLIGEKEVNGRGVWVVECVPGSASRIGDITKAVLYIDKSSYRFQQIEIESQSMGRMKLRITSARYDVKLPDSRFSFTPPQGAHVVDLSK